MECEYFLFIANHHPDVNKSFILFQMSISTKSWISNCFNNSWNDCRQRRFSDVGIILHWMALQ